MELSMQIIITNAQSLCLSKVQTHCIFPRAFNVMSFSCCVFFFAVTSNFHVHVMLEILFLVLLLFFAWVQKPNIFVVAVSNALITIGYCKFVMMHMKSNHQANFSFLSTLIKVKDRLFYLSFIEQQNIKKQSIFPLFRHSRYRSNKKNTYLNI